jgi:hypothetical protein
VLLCSWLLLASGRSAAAAWDTNGRTPQRTGSLCVCCLLLLMWRCHCCCDGAANNPRQLLQVPSAGCCSKGPAAGPLPSLYMAPDRNDWRGGVLVITHTVHCCFGGDLRCCRMRFECLCVGRQMLRHLLGLCRFTMVTVLSHQTPSLRGRNRARTAALTS